LTGRGPAAGLLLPAAGAAVAAGLVGGGLAGPLGAACGALAGLFAGGFWSFARHRRRRDRDALLSSPFPVRWRTILAHRCDTYGRLPAEWQGRFERDIRVFLSDKRITGVGVTVTDELRLLVAASAVTLSVGWEGYEWPQLAEVLLYPQDFDRDYSFEEQELSGQAHAWGTLILSVPTLQESFSHPDDAFHVGFHEFAHLLGVSESQFSGVPPGLSDADTQAFSEVMELERKHLRRGRIIDPYGEDDPVEFFAVAVEAFFECPLDLEERHPRLYTLFRDFFRQDPAAWDRARMA
jgi:MtfA peptidase